MIRMHIREKPFKCNQCNFACAQSSNLRDHTRTHMTERSFKCNKCSKLYADKRTLTKHLKVHGN